MRSLFRIIRPWLALAIVLLLGLLGIRFDASLKRSATVAGYCPKTARCTAYTSDFGRLYQNVLRSSIAKTFREEVPKQLLDPDLWVRKNTGIRPTPLRWNVWMGPMVLASHGPDGAGFCIRPGLLLRAVDRIVGKPADADGIHSFRSFFYAWREGFLIVSSSRQYVLSSLNTPPSPIPREIAPGDIQVSTDRGANMGFRLSLADELSIEGVVDCSDASKVSPRVSARRRPLTLPDFSTAPAMFSISASTFRDVRELSTVFSSAASGLLGKRHDSPFLARLSGLRQNCADLLNAQARLYALPRGWDSRMDEVRLDLVDIDTENTTPIPVGALMMRTRDEDPGPNPFAQVVDLKRAVPYEWDGNPGLILPWLGEDLSICLGRKGSDWLVTTRQPLMAVLTGSARQIETTLDADACIFVDWERLAKKSSEVALLLARNQLILRMNEEDARQNVLPFLNALARMGTLHVIVHQKTDIIRFEGVLLNADCVKKPGDDRCQPLS